MFGKVAPIVGAIRAGKDAHIREPRTAEMRSKVLQCCSCVTIGVSVRAASGSEWAELSLLTGNQNVFSMNIDAWRVILVLGVLVGLVNMLTRAGKRMLLGVEIPRQLISQPVAHGSVAAFLVLLSLTPLPTLPLLLLAVLFGSLAWSSYQQNQINEDESSTEEPTQPEITITTAQESIMKLELGSSLLPLASPELKGNIVEKMSSLRVAIVDELGLTIPSIRIKDNLTLPSNTYRIYVRGGIVGEGVVYMDRFMIVIEKDEEAKIDGIREREPVYGLPAIWVTEEVRDTMGELFVQAMNPVSVVITHLCDIVEKYASELLTREEVAVMVEELHTTSPRLVDKVFPDTLTHSRLHHVLTSLLEEQVPIKDLSTIVETASDSSNLPLEECVEQVRSTLRRQICANVSTTGFDGQQVIRCVVLPNEVELAVSNKHISKEEISAALHHAAIPLIEDGLPIVVVSSNTSRRQVSAQVANCKKDVVVLSRSEIVPEVNLQIVGRVEPRELTEGMMVVSDAKEDKQQTVAFAKSLLRNARALSVTDRIEIGIAEIRTLVGEVLEHESAGRLPPVLARARSSLLKQGVEPDLATEIVESLRSNQQLNDDELKAILIDELLRRLPSTIPPPHRNSHEPNIIALVGPTGVGKTTTIAKLAAKLRLQQGRSVALVTADTYRVAAVDQLRQYANLFDTQLEIAGTAVQMKEAIALCAHVDTVLIDTAGRSAEDGDRIQETADILGAANPSQTHLVLSAATSMTAARRAVECFSRTRFDRVIITKLDEIVTIGEIVSTLCEIDTPISWFTDGQDVASHIDLARSTRLVEMLLSNDR